MLFREIIAVYSENKMKPIDTVCGEKRKQQWWLKQMLQWPVGFKGLNAQRYIYHMA
jgi:hypothetical protein